MSNMLGIQRPCFVTYERGRSKGSNFFHERMIELYGIDLRQPPELHKIVFKDTGKISPGAYSYLSQLEVYDHPEIKQQ